MYLFEKVVYNCKKATLLSMKREEGQITVFERLELAYHLLYCPPCRYFINQSKEIRKIGKNLETHLHLRPPFSLSAEARERISNKMSGEL
jgi:hypothetical protein